MRNIYRILKERQTMNTTALINMVEKDVMYWNALPAYAEMYIKPAYENICDIEGLREFVHYFLVEYSETNNDHKKLCIEAIIFPLYKSLSGRNYDVNLIAL